MTILRLLICCFMLLAAGLPVRAESQVLQPKPAITIDRSKLLVPPKNADGSISVTPFTDNPIQWARDEQQRFYSAMSGTMRGLRGGSPLAAALSLMLLSFGYGVFHAAGPGHGKAVISGWLLATENQLRRGILIAFMSSLFQAITAILLVSIPLLLVEGAAAAARNAAGVLESASFALIAAMGLYLLYTALAPLLRARRPQAVAGGSAQTRRFDRPGQRFDIVTPVAQVAHVHGPDCGCGHAHVPAAADLNGALSASKAVSLAFAVGLRPCTGALLVLIFANAIGIYWAGIASTFAMAVGTFLTVSAIAGIAVFSKSLALRLAARDDRWLARAGVGLRLIGGVGVMGFGVLMFLASLNGPTAGM
jgi:ABC-type nickel/cobalt efflux system permease component RcnA